MKKNYPLEAKIGSGFGGVGGRSFADDAFPFELGVLKVKEKGDLQTCDGKIPNHLGDVGFVESSNDFWINDDFIIDDEVWNKFSDKVATVLDRKFLLLLNAEPTVVKLNYKCILVKLFIEPGFSSFRTFMAQPMI